MWAQPAHRQCCCTQQTSLHAPAISRRAPRAPAAPQRPTQLLRSLPSDHDGQPSESNSLTRRGLFGSAASLAVAQPVQAATSSESAGEGSGTLDAETGKRRRRPPKPLPLVPKVVLSPVQPPKKQRRRTAYSAQPIRVSKLIKGCWQLDGAHRGVAATDRTRGREAIQDFEKFMDAGMTTIDTSDVWGPSESLVGNWLRLYPYRRDQVQIITHCTIGEDDLERLGPDLIAYRVRASLARMGVSSLDLCLLQWEEPLNARSPRSKAGLVDAALWLSDLQAKGLVKAVGVANLDTPHLLEVLDAGVPVSAHQCQYSILDRRPQLFMQPLTQDRGVQLLATSVLAGGWFSDRWLGQPAAKAQLDTLSKAKAGAWLKQAGGWAWLQEMLEAMKTVSERHPGSTIASVAIAWVLQQGGASAAVVGARNASHVRDLQYACGLRLSEEDVLVLDAAHEACPKPPASDVFAWERGAAW